MKTILADGEMSRADIAGRLGLTRSTVSTLTQEMLECGYIIETGSRNDSTEKGGRPGVNLMINRSLGCILGIYILFGEYRFVLADLTGKMLISEKADINLKANDLAGIVNAVIRIAEKTAEGINSPIIGVSVAVPGVVAGDMILKNSEELGLRSYDFKKEIAMNFPLPVMLLNDVRACGTGQLFLNEKTRDENFIYLFSRTREKMGVEYPVISTALVVHGRIVNGRESQAGEFPGWYRKKMLKRFLDRRLGFLYGKEGDDGAVDEILFLIGYFDPERIYIGAGLAGRLDLIRGICRNRREARSIGPDSVLRISGLAGYDDFEVCAGAALSFLNRLYTIPQIGDADESNIDISSIVQ